MIHGQWPKIIKWPRNEVVLLWARGKVKVELHSPPGQHGSDRTRQSPHMAAAVTGTPTPATPPPLALTSHGAFSGLGLSLQQAAHHPTGWKCSCPSHLLLLLSLLLLQFLHSWLFFEPTVSRSQEMGVQPGRKVQGITGTQRVCQHTAPWRLPCLRSHTKMPLCARL